YQEPSHRDREGDIRFLGRIPSREDSYHEDHDDHEEVSGDPEEGDDGVLDAAELLPPGERDEGDEAYQPVEGEGPEVRGQGDGRQSNDSAQDANRAYYSR